MNIQEVKRLHELAVAKDFAKHISISKNKYDVIETPDPPDAILKSQRDQTLWIEITDIFRSKEEAREVYSYASGGDYTRPQSVIVEPDLQVSSKTIEGIERKINKESYQNALSNYGKGILILWIYDPLFSNTTLEGIKDTFKGSSLNSEYFDQVFINWPDIVNRKFELIL